MKQKQPFQDWIDEVSGRRVPQQQRLLVLHSQDLAAEILKLKPGHVTDEVAPKADHVALYLMKAAVLYYHSMEHNALRQRAPGRQPNHTDVAFIFVVAMGVGPNLTQELTFRNYRLPSGHDTGGKERPTKFQGICNDWMALVDPERPKPLQPAAFKTAGRYWRMRKRD